MSKSKGKIIARSIIKNRNNFGDHAKQYIYYYKDENDRNAIFVERYILTDKFEEAYNKEYKVVRMYKGKILIYMKFGILVDTLEHIFSNCLRLNLVKVK